MESEEPEISPGEALPEEELPTEEEPMGEEEDLGRLFAFCFLTLALITFLFTPYTVNLDEIKVTLTYLLCPWLLVYYLYLKCVRRRPLLPVPRSVLIALGSYLLLMAISTLLA